MNIYESKYRTRGLRQYETLKNQAYDWEEHGILSRIMTNKIFTRAQAANNRLLLYFLGYIDSFLVQLLHSVKQLKEFKNFLSKNF